VLPDFVPVNKRFWLMAEIDPLRKLSIWKSGLSAHLRPYHKKLFPENPNRVCSTTGSCRGPLFNNSVTIIVGCCLFARCVFSSEAI